MAKFKIATPQISINSSDLTAYVKEITVNWEADELESTTSGTTVTSKEFMAGLLSWTLDLTFTQDMANVDSVLAPLMGADAFPVVFRAKAASVGPDNPSYSGNCILPKYSPLGGSVGDLATAKVTLRGTGALARATS